MPFSHRDMKINRRAINEVLSGEVKRLLDAFVWKHSREGEEYWHEFFTEAKELSHEAKAALEFYLALKPLRGFAAWPKDKVKECARLGGNSVPAAKRSFSINPEFASRAGRKGGLAKRKTSNV